MTTDLRPDPGSDVRAATTPASRPSRSRTAKTKTAKTKVAGVAVVCAKCVKRQGLRPRDLRTLLKEAAKLAAGPGTKRRKLCVVTSGCLGPCPKRAVAVATGASLAAGRVMLLDPAAGPGAARALLPEFGPNAVLRGAEEPPPA